MAAAQETTITPQQATDLVAFDTERTRLVAQINAEMTQVIANFNILNDHLEMVITIGQEFDHLAVLWNHFNGKDIMGEENESVQGDQ
ncbi:hypothetical protein BG004_005718 [Podila humilis]|nr:hypothetical protein BG004_005718 [Podila humilis]